MLFTWTPFITERVIEQIKVCLAIHGQQAIIVSVAGSYDQGYLGNTHQCPADIGDMYNVPGFQIAAPGNEQEFREIFTYATQNRGLYYIRLSVCENESAWLGEPGKLHIVGKEHEGYTAVIAFGDTLDKTLKAVDDRATVCYSPWVRPFGLGEIAKYHDYDRILVVEPWYETATMQIMKEFSEIGWSTIIKSHAIPRKFIETVGWPDEIDKEVGHDVAGIRAAFEELWAL